MLVFQTALLSVFLIVLHKKLDKTLQENRRSVKIFTDRADDLRSMITNLSDIALDNNRAQEKSHSNVWAAPPNDPFLSEATHSESLENNNDRTSTENTGSSKDSLKGPLDLFSPPPPPPYVSPQNSNPFSSSAQTEKSTTDGSVDLENDFGSSNYHKEKNTHKPEQPEFENRSAKELRSLENEILCVLKRLEKTKSHLSAAQGQGQETEQERENKTT